ncbi:MAG: hypothetical protein ACKO66_07720 [Flavobacteriales bacterium]
MMTRLSILLCMLIFSAVQSWGQDERIRLIGRQYQDSVVLRWAPLNAAEWQQHNRYGYRLERFVIDENTRTKVVPQQVGADSIRPLPLEKWKSTFPKEHLYAPVAVQALYGQQFSSGVKNSGMSDIRSKAQEDMMRYSFSLLMADLDAGVANGLGLRWTDHNLPSSGNVQYRLISLHPSYRDTVEFGVRIGDPLIPVPNAPLMDLENGDKSISLRWDVQPENPVFTAYWLERSGDLGNTWTRLTTQQIIKTDQPGAANQERYVYFGDTLIAENYKQYWYRLQGITPFAELSAYSPIQIGMGQDKDAPPSPVMKMPKDVGGKLMVMWDYPEVPTDFKEFRIGKSNMVSGPFQVFDDLALPSTARNWVDESPNVMAENYYVVYALDTAGNISMSLPGYGFLLDSIAPAKPYMPVGSIDTSGVVRIHWKLGKEQDIMGYRVYFANAADHEFSNKTPYPLLDTMFVDTITLKTLTKKIYYKIAAVDRNYNHSVYSDILVLERPDIVRPVAPIFANYRVKEQEVYLEFVPSSSSDVKEHRLMRRESGTAQWQEIKTWNKPTVLNNYSDISVKGASYYEYTLMAIDSAGNASDMAPTVDVRVIAKLTRDQVNQPVSVFDMNKKAIVLTWEKPTKEVEYYSVYRGKDGKNPIALTTVEAGAIRFEDTTYPGKGAYVYMIKAFYKDRGESPFTVFKEVIVP